MLMARRQRERSALTEDKGTVTEKTIEPPVRMIADSAPMAEYVPARSWASCGEITRWDEYGTPSTSKHYFSSTKDEHEAGTQLCPIVVDGRMPLLPGSLVCYVEYPAIGSKFAGPWRCTEHRFYHGRVCQIEFEGAPDQWEPTEPTLPPPGKRSRFTKIPLCVLFEHHPGMLPAVDDDAAAKTISRAPPPQMFTEAAQKAIVDPRARPCASTVASAEPTVAHTVDAEPCEPWPGHSHGQAQLRVLAPPVLVPSRLVQPLPALLVPAAAGGDAADERRAEHKFGERLSRTGRRGGFWIASASSDGERLTVSRGYSHEHSGHYGAQFTLLRLGAKPEGAAMGATSPFAGCWRCDRHLFYDGSVLELERDGQPTRWAPLGVVDDRAFRKMDMIALLEETTQELLVPQGRRRAPLSADDSRGPDPAIRTRKHYVASLSKDEVQLHVSREFGHSGHVGEQWTLQRLAPCGSMPPVWPRESSAPESWAPERGERGERGEAPGRTYKHVFEDVMVDGRVHDATKELARVPAIQFNGARELATKASRLGVAQSYHIEHLERAHREANYNALGAAAALLLHFPELLCEVHGRTSTPPAGADPDLADHFGLSASEVRAVMGTLAERRACAVVDALVGLGVPRAQLKATFEGCVGEGIDGQSVLLIPRRSFGDSLGPRSIPSSVRAVFGRYEANRSSRLIDMHELRQALAALELSTDTARAEALLETYEKGRRAPLQLAEFSQIVDLLNGTAATGALPGAFMEDAKRLLDTKRRLPPKRSATAAAAPPQPATAEEPAAPAVPPPEKMKRPPPPTRLRSAVAAHLVTVPPPASAKRTPPPPKKKVPVDGAAGTGPEPTPEPAPEPAPTIEGEAAAAAPSAPSPAQPPEKKRPPPPKRLGTAGLDSAPHLATMPPPANRPPPPPKKKVLDTVLEGGLPTQAK